MAPSFKLYYSPTSSGAASFITAHYAKLDFDSEVTDIMAKKTASGGDFYAINPKGNVPAIVLPNGTLLNENAATLTYIADQSPESGLAPAHGTTERYMYLNGLGFITSELHRGFGALFFPMPEDAKAKQKIKAKALSDRFIDLFIGDKQFLGGDKPYATDIYAYIVLSWAAYLQIDLSDDANAYIQRVKTLAPVMEAHEKMSAA